MQVGDLVRHIVHSGALGIIVKNSTNYEAKVFWTNNNWGTKWELHENIEVLDGNR
mgnify:CR=1 FL=1